MTLQASNHQSNTPLLPPPTSTHSSSSSSSSTTTSQSHHQSTSYHSIPPDSPSASSSASSLSSTRSNHPQATPHPSPNSVPLPRPKLWPILLSLALLDFATSIYYTLDQSPSHLIFLNIHRPLILTWTFTRSLLLALAGSSHRVRTLGWVFASTGMISVLLLLWTSNEFVQNSHQPGHIPPFPLPLASFLTITLLLFFFPLAHWFAFLVSVGITNARNPFVGRSLGLGNSTRSEYWNWAEINDEDALERVVLLEDEPETDHPLHSPAPDLPSPAPSGAVQPDQISITSSPTSTADDEHDEEETDPDDILDLPAPLATPLTPTPETRPPGSSSSRSATLRSRTSWLSKHAARFEEDDEQRVSNRSSRPHIRTTSCSHACSNHIFFPDSPSSRPVHSNSKSTSSPTP